MTDVTTLPQASNELQAAILGVEPLIYTSKGNLPLSHLHYHKSWTDDANASVFVEEHRLRDSEGEVVKRSVHVMSKQGLTGEGVAASFPT